MLRFFPEIRAGILGYIRAHQVLMKHRLFKYFIIPAIVSLVYSGLYWWLTYRIYDSMIYEAHTTQGGWSEWSFWIATALFWPGAVYLFYATFKYVILILLSPVLTHLSETIEKKERGYKAPKFSLRRYSEDMKRAIRLAIRNFKYEFVICFILGWVPIVGVGLVFIVSSYFAGFGYIDYTLERHRINYEDSLKWMNRHPGLCFGIGFIFQLGMMVPVLGWLIMPTYATTAATLQACEILPPLPAEGLVNEASADPMS